MLRFFSNAKKSGCEPKEIEQMTARMFLSLVLLLTTAQFTFVQAQTKIGPVVGSSIKDFTLNDQHGSPKKPGELLADGTTALVVIKSAGW